MKGQPKSTRKNSILYSLWKVLQFLFLFAPVGVVFLCSFVNLLPGNTINKMIFTLNFVLLHGIHLPTIFKSTEITVWATKASVPQAGFFEKRIWCLCFRRGKWPVITRPCWLQKINACKKFNCCGEAFVCASCITGFGKSNDDDDDDDGCALMGYREKHLTDWIAQGILLYMTLSCGFSSSLFQQHFLSIPKLPI